MAELSASEMRLVCLCDSSWTAQLVCGGLERLGLETAIVPTPAEAEEWVSGGAGRAAAVPEQSWHQLPVDGVADGSAHRVFVARGDAPRADVAEALHRGVAAVVTFEDPGEIDLSLAQVLDYLQKSSVS